MVTKIGSIPILHSFMIKSLNLIVTKNIYLLPSYCRIYFWTQIPFIKKIASSLSRRRVYVIMAYLVIWYYNIVTLLETHGPSWYSRKNWIHFNKLIGMRIPIHRSFQRFTYIVIKCIRSFLHLKSKWDPFWLTPLTVSIISTAISCSCVALVKCFLCKMHRDNIMPWKMKVSKHEVRSNLINASWFSLWRLSSLKVFNCEAYLEVELLLNIFQCHSLDSHLYLLNVISIFIVS